MEIYEGSRLRKCHILPTLKINIIFPIMQRFFLSALKHFEEKKSKVRQALQLKKIGRCFMDSVFLAEKRCKYQLVESYCTVFL